jgi:hypothetical protein
MEILQLLCSRHYPLDNIPQLNCQLNYGANSIELIAPTDLVITSRYGPHRKHCSSILREYSLPRESVYRAIV